MQMLRRALPFILLLVACEPAPPDSDGGSDAGSVMGGGGGATGGGGGSVMGGGGGATGGGAAIDAGLPTDAGANDAGATDAGMMDAGTADAGVMDAGSSDAGAIDGGAVDAGTATDAGMTALCPAPTDAGLMDAGAVDAGPGDLTPPIVHGVTFSPATVDTSAAQQAITIDVHASDDLSGVEMGLATFRSPNGQQTVTGTFSGPPLTGTRTDGGWRTTAQVDAFSEQGTWLLDQVSVWDRVGNSTTLRATQLADAGFTQTGAGDSVAPSLQSLSFTPSTIDTSASARDVTVTINASDNLAGVGLIAFSFTSPAGNQLVSATFSRTGGTPLNGTWTGTATFPRFAEAGTWTVNGMRLFDAVLNRRDLTRAELQNASFNTTLVQSGAGDMTAPNLLGLELAPAVFSASGDDVTVCFTLRITDDAAGFSSGAIFAFSPGGSGNLAGGFTQSGRVSGTSLDGVYVATLRVPRFSAVGAWRLAFSLTDLSGHTRSIDAGTLNTLGFPSEFTVTP